MLLFRMLLEAWLYKIFTVSRKMYSRPRTHKIDVKPSPSCFLARRLLSHLVVTAICTKLLSLLALFLKYIYIYRLHFISSRLAFHFIITCAERFFLFFFVVFLHVYNVDSTNHDSASPYALK
uniref:Uncharacterized protein n=1 Tax=Ixodes ricinus TaxID=34613 RepID=A0A6B0UNW6_IXORI